MTWEAVRLEASEFERVTAELGDAHVFQSAAFAGVRQRAGWRPHFYGVRFLDRWQAAFLCLEKRRFGLSILQLSRGPVLRDGPTRPDALAAALEVVRSLTSGRLVAYLRAAPDLARAESWAETVFRAAGARRAARAFGHTATLRLSLEPDEAQLLAQMESRTRYAIRKAEQAGVEVRGGTDTGLVGDFYALYRETCDRAKIHAIPADYPTALVEAGIGRVYVSYDHERPVSGALLLRHCTGTWYLLGGSRRGVKHTGAELLQWTAIREAKAAGIRVYDFQGIPEHPSKEDPLYGVYLFKRGFGGERVELLGEFDLGSPAFMAALGASAMATLSAARAGARRFGTVRP